MQDGNIFKLKNLLNINKRRGGEELLLVIRKHLDVVILKPRIEIAQNMPGVNPEHVEAILGAFSEPAEQYLMQCAFDLASAKTSHVSRANGETFLAHMVESTYISHKEIKEPYQDFTGNKLTVFDYASLVDHDVHEVSRFTLDDVFGFFCHPSFIQGSGFEIWVRIYGISTEKHNYDDYKTRYEDSQRKLRFIATYQPTVEPDKIADRLHNMRTLEGLPEEKQLRIAFDTYMHHVPMARRIGLHEIADELQERAIHYHPTLRDINPWSYDGMASMPSELATHLMYPSMP